VRKDPRRALKNQGWAARLAQPCASRKDLCTAATQLGVTARIIE
jgi:hypothetical protein